MKHWESIGKSDEWYTLKYIFDALDTVFDMDVASPVDRKHCHVPASEFITANSIYADWKGFVWMNPPFGGINGLVPWLDKFMQHRNGIALVPDRTSAKWWQKAAMQADCILFVNGRVKFINQGGSTGKQPTTGTALMGLGRHAISALRAAESNGLGILMKRYAII